MSQEPAIHTRRLYEGKILNLRIDTVELPSGRQTEREIIEHAGCVAIVPLDADEKVILVRQYRKAAEQLMLEIPAGCIESGEQPIDCAKRELAEETKFSAKNWKQIGYFFTSPGFCTEVMYLFLATGLMPDALDADYDENIELVYVPITDVYGLISSGEIRDAKSIAGLLMALRERGY